MHLMLLHQMLNVKGFFPDIGRSSPGGLLPAMFFPLQPIVLGAAGVWFYRDPCPDGGDYGRISEPYRSGHPARCRLIR